MLTLQRCTSGWPCAYGMRSLTWVCIVDNGGGVSMEECDLA